MTSTPINSQQTVVNLPENETEESPCCMFCMDEDIDEPVVMNVCSCRGEGAGYHLKCLVEFAKTKTEDAISNGEGRLDEIWSKCSTCKQEWTGNVAADMGKECLSFICKKCPGNGYLKFAALGIKRRGIVSSGTSSLEDQKRAAQDVLAAFEECFNGEQSILEYALHEKYSAHYSLAEIALKCRDFYRAIDHFTKAEESLGEFCQDKNHIGFMELQMQIVQAQCKQRGEDAAAISKTLLPFLRAIFEKSKEMYGKDSHITLGDGFYVALILCEIGQLNEAEELISGLHSKAQRVLGPDHDLTKKIKVLMSKHGMSE